jgi:hypothetical protein
MGGSESFSDQIPEKSTYATDSSAPLGEIRENPSYGSYAVARRNISSGELVCEEYPLMIGPGPGRSDGDTLELVCLTCYRKCDKERKCSLCQWPVCDNMLCQNVSYQYFSVLNRYI